MENQQTSSHNNNTPPLPMETLPRTKTQNHEQNTKTPQEIKVTNNNTSLPEQTPNTPIKIPRSSSPKAKLETLERRTEISEILSRLGAWGKLNRNQITQLSEKWNCNPDTIYEDIKKLTKTALENRPDLNQLAQKFYVTQEAILKRGTDMLNDKNPSVAKNGADMIINCVKAMTEMLEKFGIKPRLNPEFDLIENSEGLPTKITIIKHQTNNVIIQKEGGVSEGTKFI